MMFPSSLMFEVSLLQFWFLQSDLAQSLLPGYLFMVVSLYGVEAKTGCVPYIKESHENVAD